MTTLKSLLPAFPVLLAALSGGHAHAQTSHPPLAKDFAVETLATELSNPVEMSIAGDLVFIAELHGNIKVVNLKTNKTHVAAHLEVDYRKPGPKWSWDVESGVLGIAVAPDFATSKWVYVCYSRPGGESIKHDHVVSRFRYRNRLLDKESEQIILKIPAFRDQDRIHEAGSLAFGPRGNLYISSGDNQDHRQYLDAARTSANSAVLNGKILRIRPGKDGGYTIPAGNLFPPGTPKTRPEIYIMGLRNPYRISVDQKTGYLYWGENGPSDYYCGNLTNVDRKLLPLGFDEFNQAKKPGFYGWPLFIGPNEAYPNYSFETNSVTGPFNPEKPVNDYRENTGILRLPAAQKPMIWYSHPPSPDFPSLGQGGASAIAGPVYYHDPSRPKDSGGLPKAFDHHWFIADYARGWVKMVELDKDDQLVAIKSLPVNHHFQTPINLKFNRDGQLFVLQYGTGGWAPDNGGSLVRISHRPDAGLAGNRVIEKTTLKGMPAKHPGTALMRSNNCTACHETDKAAIGPSFQQIVERYGKLATRRQYLKEQIRNGSKGVWGESQAMPAHAHLSSAQLEQIVDAIFKLRLAKHSALGRPVHLAAPPSPRYPGSGPAGLVDGIRGDTDNLTRNWLGYEGRDITATVDLGKTIRVQELGLSAMQHTASGIFLPPEVKFLVSSDGETFTPVARARHQIPVKKTTAKTTLTAKIKPVKARYIRVHVKSLGTIPDWHHARGGKAWLFVDELLVNPAKQGK